MRQIKTDLLNQFLALIETGRYGHADGCGQWSVPGDINQLRALAQFAACVAQQRTPSTGSGRTHIAWASTRRCAVDEPTHLQREPLHDDHLLACAFTGLLAGAPLARPMRARRYAASSASGNQSTRITRRRTCSTRRKQQCAAQTNVTSPVAPSFIAADRRCRRLKSAEAHQE